MIKRISDMVMEFSIVVHPPASKWGKNRSLDQTGATLHLSSTYSVVDKDVFRWIKENDLSYSSSVHFARKALRVEFINIEDAMAFKLRWT